MLKELKRFHRDDGGAPELSTIMLIALIALPLIIGLILFANRLWDRFRGRVTDAGTQAGQLDNKVRTW